MRRATPSALNLLSLRNLRGHILPLFPTHRFSSLVVNVPRSNIYRFGDGQRAVPALRDVQWSVKEGESWVITGNQRNDIVEILLGHTRITPSPSGGLYPFLVASGRDPHDLIAHVSFAPQRLASGGAFYDFTARYGAVREEDRMTLRESLGTVDESLAETLDLKRLLDLPLVALSNGQTRRARILQALMRNPAPEVLVLTEPLIAGLDVEHRPRLLKLLHDLHIKRAPRVIMTLRGQDPVPDWATHIIRAENGKIIVGERSQMVSKHSKRDHKPNDGYKGDPHKIGKPIVEIVGLNIAYHERKILTNVNWTIREGERWHLKGPNGSGKTTLLAMITGDHPQSYSQPASSLRLFSKPRRSIPTTTLQRRIGLISPEQYNAFPRRIPGLSVRDAIGTGFDSTYAFRTRTTEEEARIDELIRAFNFGAGKDGEKEFALLSAGEQALVLLMRALVSKAPLLILDEPFAGMDDAMVENSKRYLLEKLEPYQAVVLVTHWAEEVPWPPSAVQHPTHHKGSTALSSEPECKKSRANGRRLSRRQAMMNRCTDSLVNIMSQMSTRDGWEQDPGWSNRCQDRVEEFDAQVDAHHPLPSDKKGEQTKAGRVKIIGAQHERADAQPPHSLLPYKVLQKPQNAPSHRRYGGQQQGYGGQQQGYGGYGQSRGPGGWQAGPPQGPPPGADPQLWTWFSSVDSDRSGAISANELQQALVNGDWSPFDLDTVKMLMSIFDTDRSGTIGFNEFSGLWRYIKDWQGVFKHFDRDNSGSIDGQELSQAMNQFGYPLNPQLLDLVQRKYDVKGAAPIPGGPPPGITFDRFVRACVVVKSLTESFRRLDTDRDGWIQINYDTFIHTCLSAP
ncbi:P-loop containing nucleoside triphosphate hydrolase protein, partial [Rhizoctonia solani]